MIEDVFYKWADKPFRYGQDCCQFVSDCIKDDTGVDFASRFRYRNKKGADDILSQHGDLDGLMASMLDIVKEPRQGDVAVVKMTDGRKIAGYVYRGRIVVRTPMSLTDWPVDAGNTFYRVPECLAQ